MTLDEVIKRFEHNAEFERRNGNLQGCLEFRQLVEWLSALQEYKDVLTKIRTEINQYGSIWVQYTIKGHTDKDIEDIVEDVIKQAKQQMLDLIDKYRNEVSEE